MNAQQEFDRRVARVREGMREQGLETLLVFESGRHNFLRTNYVAYLTDFISVGPQTILHMPLDDEPILYTSPDWDIPRAKDEAAVADVRSFERIWDELPKLRGAAGVVGKESMHSGLYGRIARALDRAPINAKEIIDSVARCKTEFELERLGRAALIADAGVKALHEDARVGLKEFELAAIVEHRMRSLGAEDNFGMIVANSHNQALHPPTDRTVENGDIIIGEITPCVGGLFVQICRTMVLGEPPPIVREKYGILERAMKLGLNAAKTGSPASDIAAAINGAFYEAGYEKYCRPPFMRVRGHGLGCGSFAPGSLEDANKTRLEQNMTFIIHPNQYLPESGYLTLGDTVVMTAAGAEPMTHSSWELYVKQ
jgi:Xaa-Pro dipeptidase